MKKWSLTFQDEVYDKARGEILDEIVNLSQLDSQDWENALQKALWEKTSSYIFENIYLPAALVESAGSFNTVVDIRLKHWADKDLPQKCIQVVFRCCSAFISVAYVDFCWPKRFLGRLGDFTREVHGDGRIG